MVARIRMRLEAWMVGRGRYAYMHAIPCGGHADGKCRRDTAEAMCLKNGEGYWVVTGRWQVNEDCTRTNDGPPGRPPRLPRLPLGGQAQPRKAVVNPSQLCCCRRQGRRGQ